MSIFHCNVGLPEGNEESDSVSYMYTTCIPLEIRMILFYAIYCIYNICNKLDMSSKKQPRLWRNDDIDSEM